MTEVSIIVPVYNIANYLPRCVNSLLKQDIVNIEVLLVDDGSSDGSSQLCDDFAQKDGRIRVIHQKNSGVSSARNRGISEARGRYIGFADGDDWVAEDMFSALFNIAEEQAADVVICDCFTACGKSLELDSLCGVPQNKLLKKESILPEWLLNMAGVAWRCFYRADLLKQGVCFPTSMKISEDRVFNISAMGRAESIYYLPKPLYYRFVRKGSAVNRYYPDFLSMVMLARDKTAEELDRYWTADFKPVFERHTVALCYTALNMVCYKDNKKSFSQRLAETEKICCNPDFLYAIRVTGVDDIRARLIKHGSYKLLTLLSLAANLKNGR